MTGQQQFTITELAREFQVTPRAIRYYEDQGLLMPARQGRNRTYNRQDRSRLKLALRGRRLGLSLAEIRELLDLYHTEHDEQTQLTKFLVILRDRRAALEQQREDIEALLEEIDALETRCLSLLDTRRPG